MYVCNACIVRALALTCRAFWFLQFEDDMNVLLGAGSYILFTVSAVLQQLCKLVVSLHEQSNRLIALFKAEDQKAKAEKVCVCLHVHDMWSWPRCFPVSCVSS